MSTFDLTLPAAPELPGPTEAPTLRGQGALLSEPQWRARTFHLVNWGGFEGPMTFDLSADATLISGASGAGKSTLLDAYIALTMPSETSFNGASNDAQPGRARSPEQRNLLSYLRGKLDTTEEDGRSIDKVLRGQGQATWGAIAMTFADDHGRTFTALRTYWVPARATRSGDVLMRLLTIEDPFTVTDLELYTTVGEEHFPAKALRGTYPSLRAFDTYATFSQALFTKLGIGANGDGSKALRLLARIQAGQNIRTVDELYKDMVLERPATYTAADNAITHFDELDASYRAMLVEHQKAELLGPITARYTELLAARAEAAALDALGLAEPGDTPATLWRLRTHSRLYTRAIQTNRADAVEVEGLLIAIGGEEAAAAGKLREAQDAHSAAGGDLLTQLATRIGHLTLSSGHIERRLAQVSDAARTLAMPLTCQDDFTALTRAAAAFPAEQIRAQEALDQRLTTVTKQQFPLSEAQRELRKDLEHFETRTGRIPRWLDELRTEAAHASGMALTDLPFIAELIDIPEGHARWRTAIEVVLSGVARQVLVPTEHFESFSAAIDHLAWKSRLRFTAATRTDQRPTPGGDPDKVAGKLTYQDSPYAMWVHRTLNEAHHNALCVESTRDLSGPGVRVTLSGQTRTGTSGSHGGTTERPVIGFSNDDLIEATRTELDRIAEALSVLDTTVADIKTDQRALHLRGQAFQAATSHTWADIDVWSVTKEIASLEAQRTALLRADNALDELQRQVDALTKAHDDILGRRHALTARRTQISDQHGQLVEEQDEVNTDLYRVEDAGNVELSHDLAARLDAALNAEAAPGRADALEDFAMNLGRVLARLRQEMTTARTNIDRAGREIEDKFKAYRLKWDEDPNLGESIEYYPDYAQILERILTTGLHERRQEWRRRLMVWSGQDLVPLNQAMTASIEDIEDRLGPINAILWTLPFGATSDRLQIHLRRLNLTNVATFRAELRRFSAMATADLGDAALEARFLDLQRFIAQIRARDDAHLNADLAPLADRDKLLDVRRHVEITAERQDLNRNLLSTHSSLGGKSGGESQELIAFIVGAALRFRLGDDLRSRPRFAPVFIDEGFIKADGEFAGRAFQAWRGLGFQLIVGAPQDKVTALERHVNRILIISKNLTKGYSFVDTLQSPELEQA